MSAGPKIIRDSSVKPEHEYCHNFSYKIMKADGTTAKAFNQTSMLTVSGFLLLCKANNWCVIDLVVTPGDSYRYAQLEI